MKQCKIVENGDLVFADTGKGVYCYRMAADRSQSILAAAIIGIMTEGDVARFREHFETMTGYCTSRCAAFEGPPESEKEGRRLQRVYCSAIQEWIGELVE
jgi:hypothetical protein